MSKKVGTYQGKGDRSAVDEVKMRTGSSSRSVKKTRPRWKSILPCRAPLLPTAYCLLPYNKKK